MTLLQVHDEADIQDIVLQNQVADVVMLCLPGIASGLLEVAVGSDIQNHKITKVMNIIKKNFFKLQNLNHKKIL